jgi:hypothetical protein
MRILFCPLSCFRTKFINIGKTNKLGKWVYLEDVIKLHSNTLNHMKITHFSAKNYEENYFKKYKVKVKQSRSRPGVAQRVPGS